MNITEETRIFSACELLELAVDVMAKDWPRDYAALPKEMLIGERNTDNARMSILLQAVLKELEPLRGGER